MFDAVMIVLSSISLTLSCSIPSLCCIMGRRSYSNLLLWVAPEYLILPYTAMKLGFFEKKTCREWSSCLLHYAPSKSEISTSVLHASNWAWILQLMVRKTLEKLTSLCLIHIHSLAVPHQSFWLVYELLLQLHIMLCCIKLAISFPKLFDRFGKQSYIKLSVFCSQEQIGVASGSQNNQTPRTAQLKLAIVITLFMNIACVWNMESVPAVAKCMEHVSRFFHRQDFSNWKIADAY